jgi:hypothetical protein
VASKDGREDGLFYQALDLIQCDKAIFLFVDAREVFGDARHAGFTGVPMSGSPLLLFRA